jgi:hypothetical protein
MRAIMISLHESDLTFSFPDDWNVSSYDKWGIYQKHIKDCCGGLKAVDFLAIDPDNSRLVLNYVLCD